MTIYNFSFNEDDKVLPNKKLVAPEPKDALQPREPERVPDPLPKQEVLEELVNRDSDIITQVLSVGFRTQDAGIKSYFSNLKVPIKDGFKDVNVKIAGGDRTIMAWKDERKNGRLILPVLSINRVSAEYNPAKFSPPHIEMTTRFVDSSREHMEVIYRPSPWNISYQLTLWAERKTDAEYVMFQIISRYDPMAQWIVQDEWLRGVVDSFLQGWTNSSDVDAANDQLALVRYDFNILVEGWLPRPTKIVPTILGSVQTQELATAADLEELSGFLEEDTNG